MYFVMRLDLVTFRFSVLACVFVCALGLIAPAGASQLIARNASNISLQVNTHGKALITYRAGGRLTHLLAWGAINARPRPATPSGPRQVKFKVDYSGGWGPWRKLIWKHFKNACQPYDGPEVAWFVTACKAPDGSYWALQSWQTALPDLGFVPWMKTQRTWWLHLSHWSGPLPQLDVYLDWAYSGRFQHLFGQFTYKGRGVRGFGTTLYGAPTDGYGRLVYVDTHNSAYGPGWKRENSFVSSGPPGLFCYGFYKFNPYVNGYAHPPGTLHRKRGPGTGDMYRVTAGGPGVTPDVMWQGAALHQYDANNPADVTLEHDMNAKLTEIRAGWPKCHA
jgi:hypothetical protein